MVSIIFIALNVICGASRAFPQGILTPSEWTALHKRDVSTWERKSGMPSAWIDKILQATGRGAWKTRISSAILIQCT